MYFLDLFVITITGIVLTTLGIMILCQNSMISSHSIIDAVVLMVVGMFCYTPVILITISYLSKKISKR